MPDALCPARRSLTTASDRHVWPDVYRRGAGSFSSILQIDSTPPHAHRDGRRRTCLSLRPAVELRHRGSCACLSGAHARLMRFAALAFKAFHVFRHLAGCTDTQAAVQFSPVDPVIKCICGAQPISEEIEKTADLVQFAQNKKAARDRAFQGKTCSASGGWCSTLLRGWGLWQTRHCSDGFSLIWSRIIPTQKAITMRDSYDQGKCCTPKPPSQFSDVQPLKSR